MTAPAGDTTTVDTDTSATDTDAGQPAEGVKLTPEQQAFVDQMFAKRLREAEQRRTGEVERRVQEMLEREKMSAAEKAQAERDEARATAEQEKTTSRQSVAEARVETALLAAGIKPTRLEAVSRLVNLAPITEAEDSKAQRDAAAEAVRQVLADFPEFKPTPGASGGELGGGGQEGAVTAKQFAEMDYDARSALYQRDPALYRRLRDAA